MVTYLTKIEAAMRLGYSVELIDYFTQNCPKRGEERKLVIVSLTNEEFFDESVLLSFHRYLNEPWPLPEKGGRAYIPQAIMDDVKQESHHSCAICGLMDNGEVAHIISFATTRNNSPDNLIYLCPNHHTKYDYGYIIASNITLKEVEPNARLKALEEKIWTWDLNSLNQIMDLFSKPRIIA